MLNDFTFFLFIFPYVAVRSTLRASHIISIRSETLRITSLPPRRAELYALKCKNCHRDTHVVGQSMPPGHADWHLPPANLKLVFEGKSPRQLAMHFKDPKFTGFKTMDKMLEHIEKEPLVTNSWTYGTPPPLSHEEFVEKVKEWIAKGAAIPDK